MRSSIGRFILAVLAVASLAAPSNLWAQRSEILDRCTAIGAGGSPEAGRRCNLIVQTIDILQPPMGMAVSGGNPVPGTASTLGMRLGSFPRISLGGRLTLIGVDLPQVLDFSRSDEIDVTFPGLNFDAAIGILEGGSPLPTLGGVGSVDLLASFGVLPLSSGAGFRSGSRFTWALGLRGGIFRESFTVPGISVSTIYRHLARSTLGDPDLDDTDSFLELNVSNLSLRAAASKRILGIGFTAGAGYDIYWSSGRFGFLNPGPAGDPEYRLSYSGVRNNRTSLFANISYTLLILHLVGELGWQQGSDLISAPLPANARVDTGGRIFGGVAVRLSI